MYDLLVLNSGDGQTYKLPFGSTVNLAGVTGGTFLVGGYPVLTHDGNFNVLQSLQTAYDSGSGQIQLSSNKNLVIKTSGPNFEVDFQTGNISTGLLNGIDIQNLSSVLNLHLVAGSSVKHLASEIYLSPIPGISAVNVQEGLQQVLSKSNSFEHIQTTESTTWVINHQKNTNMISVTLYDDFGNLFIPDNIRITNNNTVTVSLVEAVSGRAVLSVLG